MFDKPLSETLTHRHRGLSFSKQYGAPVEMPTGAAASSTWPLHKVNTLATHTQSCLCPLLSLCQHQVPRGRLGRFGGHRDVIHTCLHMHTHVFIHRSFTHIAARWLLSSRADMHTMLVVGSPDPSRVLSTRVFAKPADSRRRGIEACEVGTETVFFSAVQPCPQPAAACSPACLKMSLFLRKRPSFMSTLLSAPTCQLGRVSPNSPLRSAAVITPLRIHSNSLPIHRREHLLQLY